MRWRQRYLRGGLDEGSALIEFVFLAVVLLIPLVYLVITVARIQAGSLAVEQAAREASRAFVTAPDIRSGDVRARAAAALAYGDQGFRPPAPGQVAIACGGESCLEPGERVTVRTELVVVLPGVPRFLSDVIPVSVTLDATHVASVDEFARR